MKDSPLVANIADWLYRQALISAEIEATVGELGNKLLAGGIPVCRINVGGMLLHPVLGAVDVTWESITDKVTSQAVPRSFIATEAFRNAPFYNMGLHNVRFERFDLRTVNVRKMYPVLENLASLGITDYLAFFETFGQSRKMEWAGLPPSAEGSYLSYSTKRLSGFDNDEIAKLADLSLPFSLAMKVAVDKMLTITLLETYLGKTSGKSVYSGDTSQGDGQNIDCVLWYSDLRNSTSLAASMGLVDYLSLINEYYSCTAGSVLDHGGEVLKFIGDGILAIFPYDDDSRPLRDMTNAAVMTAKDSLTRNVLNNKEREEVGQVPLSFGIGLHVGQVMYGNVGTEQRLDMTVTGPAVNEVTRYEMLTKELQSAILMSADFKDSYHGKLQSFGHQELKGLPTPKEVFGLSEKNTQ
ncbi:MAG: adenylate/guanylate cyclase domain-containing protein [Rhodobacteraceae bacterium]|nr:adenylate/guanylate cyclase domain-containing protein [Paracoccaceae bacterium]